MWCSLRLTAVSALLACVLSEVIGPTPGDMLEAALRSDGTWEEPVYTHDWLGTNKDVWSVLLAPVAGKPLKALEVGSYQGRSALWMMEHVLTHPTSTLTCVDLFREDSEGLGGITLPNGTRVALQDVFLFNTRRFAHKISLRVGSSHDVLRSFPPVPTYDIAYIDGDHHAYGVMEDAVLVFRLMKEGGIIIFDDYAWEYELAPRDLDKPKMGINSFAALFADALEIIHVGYQVVVKKTKHLE